MSHAPTDTLNSRHQSVRTRLVEHHLDALVVTSMPNVLYLTNFSGTTAIVVVTGGRIIFITDSRYTAAIEQARGTLHECPALELVTVEGTYDLTLARLLASVPGSRVGFEAAHLSVARHAWLRKAVGVTAAAPLELSELVRTEGLIERVRVQKDKYEIGVLTEAAQRLSAVATGAFREVRRDRSEREIALAIDWRIRNAGFERSAFETIVASGPNAALPHARPSERKLTEGDLVVLDFGGVYESYCVDLTRSVSVGPASARARRVHAVVLDAHDKAIGAVAPGRSRFDIDEAARAAVDKAGMGAAFGHGTGHGLGIEVHEDPSIVRRRSDVDGRDEALAAGMVFTIEPGAYFPGWGGLRIEDDVVVTEGGVEVLTDVTTELLEL